MEEGGKSRASVGFASSLIGVAIALTGAIASLFGVWLGNQNAAQVQRENLRHDDQAAMRDLRREAYEGLLATVDKYRRDHEHLRNLVLDEGEGSEAVRRASSNVESELGLVGDRFTAVSIVGSRRAVELANQLVRKLQGMPILIVGAAASAWVRYDRDIDVARTALLTQVRLELGVQD